MAPPQSVRIEQTDEFSDWLGRLRDRDARLRITDRLEKVARGHFGDVKALGNGVAEMRFHFGAGYRVFHSSCIRRLGRHLAGRRRQGDAKARHSTCDAACTAGAMTMTTRPFDAAEYLFDEPDVMGFLEAAMEDGDTAHVDRAFETVTRSPGWHLMVARHGLSSDDLSRGFAAARASTFDEFEIGLRATGLALRIERLAA